MLRRIAAQAPRRVTTKTSVPTGALLSRHISSTLRTMAPLTQPSAAITKPLPSDGFQLLAEKDKAGEAEDALYEQQIKQVEEWWASERYKGIKRPYSAHDIVSKRGSQLQSYPSSVMARKLFNLIKEREADGKPIHTSKYLIISNWQSARADRLSRHFEKWHGRKLTKNQWAQLTQSK